MLHRPQRCPTASAPVGLSGGPTTDAATAMRSAARCRDARESSRALAQGFSIGQPDLGLAHARERRPGQGVEGAAQRWTTANPRLASVVQAVLDDTHRAAMRAPARDG